MLTKIMLPMLKLYTNTGFHDLLLKFIIYFACIAVLVQINAAAPLGQSEFISVAQSVWYNSLCYIKIQGKLQAPLFSRVSCFSNEQHQLPLFPSAILEFFQCKYGYTIVILYLFSCCHIQIRQPLDIRS